MEFLVSQNTNVLIVNTEVTKVKMTVVINFKWHNLDYPHYPEGRRHVTFPATTKMKCNLGRFCATDYENWPVILHYMYDRSFNDTISGANFFLLMRCFSMFMKTDLGSHHEARHPFVFYEITNVQCAYWSDVQCVYWSDVQCVYWSDK